jgi:hypothetical protein
MLSAIRNYIALSHSSFKFKKMEQIFQFTIRKQPIFFAYIKNNQAAPSSLKVSANKQEANS